MESKEREVVARDVKRFEILIESVLNATKDAEEYLALHDDDSFDMTFQHIKAQFVIAQNLLTTLCEED